MPLFRLLADLVLIVHLAFVVFVVAGGILVLRWPAVAWAHLPAATWGVLIELFGWMCPLTGLEQALRARSGEGSYEGGFVDHYITSILYPSGLTRSTQLILGMTVLLLNLFIYTLVIRRRRKSTRSVHGAGL